MHLLITGVAGFIGFHLTKARLALGDTVIGVDNLNEYYDVKLKHARLEQLQQHENFIFYQEDITNLAKINAIFKQHAPQRVVNLAAQAGVRYSISHPHVYVQSNVVGFTNIIEACRHYGVEHLVYASTSSVYGANLQQPNSENHATNHPLTIYAATKKANELIAHSYSHLYQLSTVGLRFFTAYGPWGRPDMAFFSFTRNILAGLPIQVFNHGNMKRDFTYIDDIVSGISAAIDTISTPNNSWNGLKPEAASSNAPYKIYNLGYGSSVNLMDYIQAIENATGKKAIKEFLPLQEGDVLATQADTDRLHHDLAYLPTVNFEEGIKRFVDWYLTFYH